MAGFDTKAERSLALHSLHTGESLETVYWRKVEYLQEGLAAIDFLLRDHRSGEQMPIDRRLFNLLSLLHHTFEGQQPFSIISGFSSSQSNAILRSKSNGVSQKSYHMRGMAIDLRLPGIALETLHQAALKLAAGGVGYYPKSDFIHLDTGPLRQWQG